MEDNWVYAAMAALPVAAALGLYLFFIRCKQHRSAPPRWWKLLLGNLLVLLFAVSSAAFLGETYFRFGCDTTDSFAITKTCQRWFARHYHVNAMGFRDDQDYWPAPAPGKRRVSFVGDSFTAGHGIRDVADRFANRIRTMHSHWEVHVLAKGGFETGNELELLGNLAGGAYQFDQVVLVYCLNDIGDATQQLADRARKINEEGRRRPGFWFEHSYLLNTLYYRTRMHAIPEMGEYYGYQHDAYFSAAWEAHAPRLKAIRDIVRDCGGQLCVVTFPYLHAMGPDYAFRDVHRRLRDFWKEAGVAHLDLLPVYEAHPPRALVVNAHDAHPNARAHALAAEAISRFLDGQERLNGPAGPSVPGQAPPAARIADRLVACYREILDVDPDNLGVHLRLGDALAARGQRDDAVAQYSRVLAIDPDCTEAHNNLGLVLASRGDLEAAMAHHRRASELKPDDWPAHYNLGRVLAQLGRTDEAVAQYETALAIHPRGAEIHYDLALLRAGRGQSDQALAHYETALTLNPNYAEAHNNLGNLLARRGQFDEAIAHYRQALAVNPDDADARANLAAVEAARAKAAEGPPRAP